MKRSNNNIRIRRTIFSILNEQLKIFIRFLKQFNDCQNENSFVIKSERGLGIKRTRTVASPFFAVDRDLHRVVVLSNVYPVQYVHTVIQQDWLLSLM